MRKFIDSYLVIAISINMLFALTIVCAPNSSMNLLESFFGNPKVADLEGQSADKEIKLLGVASGTIEIKD